MSPDVIVTTNKDKLDIQLIYDFLHNEAYWAQGRTLEQVRDSVNNSICFGLFVNDKQVGFARLITDYVTFGYLCDVFILPKHRQHGYSKILMNYIMADDTVKNIRKLLLITSNAHFLYEQFGFAKISSPEKFMEIKLY